MNTTKLTSLNITNFNFFESSDLFRNIFYFLFGFSRLDKVNPPKDPSMEGYSRKLIVKYFMRDKWHTVECRYYFETKWLRFFDEKGESFSLEPSGINQDGFHWKLK